MTSIRQNNARAVALALAGTGEVPVAAIITDSDGQIIAEAVNAMQETAQATAHAEMLAMQLAMAKAARLVCQSMIFGSPEPCACVPARSAMRCAAFISGRMIRKAGRLNMAPACSARKPLSWPNIWRHPDGPVQNCSGIFPRKNAIALHSLVFLLLLLLVLFCGDIVSVKSVIPCDLANPGMGFHPRLLAGGSGRSHVKPAHHWR